MSVTRNVARGALRTAAVSAAAAALLMSGAAGASAHPVPGNPQPGYPPHNSQPQFAGGGSGGFQTPFGYVQGGMYGHM